MDPSQFWFNQDKSMGEEERELRLTVHEAKLKWVDEERVARAAHRRAVDLRALRDECRTELRELLVKEKARFNLPADAPYNTLVIARGGTPQ